MDRYFACLGLISCLVIGTLARESVRVISDIEVKPTPDPLTDVSKRVNVTLNCTGSRSDLSFYIKNVIRWTFRGSDGTVRDRSLAFYVNDKLDKTKFSIDYGAVSPGKNADGFFVNLKISGVTHSDNGIYRCSLLDEAKNVTDYKDIRLTVLNPVENVSIELHDSKYNVIAQSSSAITQNEKPTKIPPGQYMVKCNASGSNPAPVMALYYNKNQTHVVTDSKEETSGNRVQYMGSYSVMDLNINVHTAPQALVCKANIPGDHYPIREAGIALMVQIEKPIVRCDNATAEIGDKHAKLKCNLSAEDSDGALMCEKVSWLLSNSGQRIGYEQTWKDPNSTFDILESACQNKTDGLKVSLDLYTVKPELVNETYFLVYGVGDNAHRHPVMLHDITVATTTTTSPPPPAAAGTLTPLPLLACLVIAVVSKHIANL